MLMCIICMLVCINNYTCYVSVKFYHDLFIRQPGQVHAGDRLQLGHRSVRIPRAGDASSIFGLVPQFIAGEMRANMADITNFQGEMRTKYSRYITTCDKMWQHVRSSNNSNDNNDSSDTNSN